MLATVDVRYADQHRVQQYHVSNFLLQVISDDLGLKLETTDISMMGRAKKITITKDDTIILDGSGDKAAIGERCDQIREAIAQSQSDYDR